MHDWENLRYFLAVARNGTVSAAAQDLCVAHSTVLRRIEQFEETLDAKLFKRLQRGYALTRAGETLYDDARSVENDIERALNQAQGRYDVTEGILRISQPEHGIVNLYPLFAEFLQKHPEISLQVYSTMQQANLNQQEVDIAFRFSDAPPDLLIGRKLGPIKTKCYATTSYLQRKGAQAGLEDFEWIIWHQMTTAATQWLERYVTSPRIILHAQTMPDVLNAILNGMGVGFLSSHEAEKHPELVPLLGDKAIGQHILWMLNPRELRSSSRVTTFMQFIADRLVLK